MINIKKYFDTVLTMSTSKILNELKNITEPDEIKKNEIRRRWIWELIQNATDCTPSNSTINISLEITDTKICFSHDGIPFSYDNLFSLITQASEKQESKEEMTGKFGTGFMSTFLLSGIVEIEGAFIRQNGTWTDMNFMIDRSNIDYESIRKKTGEMLASLEELNHSTNEVVEKINKTKFIYNLNGTPESIKAVKKGGEDLQATLLYLLAFNEKINSVKYNGKIYKRETTNPLHLPWNDKVFTLKTDDLEYDNIEMLLFLQKENVTIACPVKYDFVNNLLTFLPIPENIPKLFCNFPLIGSENYAFPIIVNSSHFDVETDRNTIRDGNTFNKYIIEVAIYLYKTLINYCEEYINTRNEYNICLLEKRQYLGLQKYCYDEITNYIKSKSLIPIINPSYSYERRSYLNGSGNIQIILPKSQKQENDTRLWHLLQHLSNGADFSVPMLDSFMGWKQVFGGNYSFKRINSHLEDKTIINLNKIFSHKTKTYKWLNEFYSLWIDDESMENVIKSAFILTQNKNFREINKVFYDADINEDFKIILSELDPSYKNDLLDRSISAFDTYFDENPLKQKDTSFLAEKLENIVINIFSDETINSAIRETELQTTFNKLFDLHLKESALFEEYLPKILSKRMLLSSPEETLRRMSIAEKFEQSGLDIDGLDEVLGNQEQIKVILANPSLSNEQIRGLLKHVVISTPEMRKYFEDMLARSVLNVYNYLRRSPKYELPLTLEEWQANKYTETIFPIMKDKKELTIVIRPTDGDQVIFYGEEELEILDSTEYELWTDNGIEQKILTLGDLLKTTGITRIPLNKI